jgi:hypothetical protein
MPKKNRGAEKAEIIRIRISTKERERCKEAQLAGVFRDEAEAAFMGYLVKLGLNKYEQSILPIERGVDTPAAFDRSASKREAAS